MRVEFDDKPLFLMVIFNNNEPSGYSNFIKKLQAGRLPFDDKPDNPAQPLINKEQAFNAAGSLVGMGLNIAQQIEEYHGFNTHPTTNPNARSFTERAASVYESFIKSMKSAPINPSKNERGTSTEPIDGTKATLLTLKPKNENAAHIT